MNPVDTSAVFDQKCEHDIKHRFAFLIQPRFPLAHVMQCTDTVSGKTVFEDGKHKAASPSAGRRHRLQKNQANAGSSGCSFQALTVTATVVAKSDPPDRRSGSVDGGALGTSRSNGLVWGTRCRMGFDMGAPTEFVKMKTKCLFQPSCALFLDISRFLFI